MFDFLSAETTVMSLCACVRACMCACMRSFACLCSRVCVCVCMLVFAYVSACKCVFVCIQACVQESSKLFKIITVEHSKNVDEVMK